MRVSLAVASLCASFACAQVTDSKLDGEQRYYKSRQSGIVATQNGEYDMALIHFQDALSAARLIGEPARVARSTFNVATTNYWLGNYEAAIQQFNQFLSLLNEHRLTEAQLRSNALAFLCFSHRNLKHMDVAIGFCESAVPDLQDSQKATVLSELGVLLGGRDDPKSLDYFRQAASIYQLGGDFRNLANVQMGAGAFREMHNPGEAEILYRMALDAAKQAKEPQMLYRAYRGLARAAAAQAQYDRALGNYLAAEHVAPSVSASDLNRVLRETAELHASLHDFRQQVAYLERAASIYRESPNSMDLAATLGELGSAYEFLDEYDRSYTAFEDALKALASQSADPVRATILTNYASAQERKGDIDAAMAHYEQAFHIYMKLGDHEHAADTAGRILATPAAAKLSVSQRAELMSALQTSPSKHDYTGLLHSRAAIAAVAQSNLPEAAHEFQAAADFYGKMQDVPGLAQSVGSLAWVRELQGNDQVALTNYDSAVMLFDRVRDRAAAAEVRTAFGATYDDIYASAVAAALRANDVRRAFEYCERQEARSLMDRLAGLTSAREDRPPEARRQQELREQIRELARRAQLASPDRRAQLESMREARELQYYALQESPVLIAYNRHFVAAPQSLPDIQKMLDVRTTLLSYFTTRDRTIAFVVTKSSIQATDLGVKFRDLSATIRRTRLDNDAAAWEQLNRWLIHPIEAQLRTERIGIIPQSDLNSLSFAYLPAGDGKRLVDRYVLFYLPSGSSLKFLPPNREIVKPRFLAVYQPAGTGVDNSARFVDLSFDQIASRSKATVLRDDDATESKVRAHMRDAHVTYISAHAAADTRFPALSLIFLKADEQNDGRLTVEEIYGLSLDQADLVVLAACETGAPVKQLGEDAVSLNRAFHAAGAASVISTLRTVNSTVASDVMDKFFWYLGQGNDKAAALALAQRTADRSNPDWAAFVLTGRPGHGL